ncbi:MAG: diaminopropionate ammonia-lyase [Eubacteriales bacterium]|nr:diaminopropionate ammonia-lyase [Eubacteriales bacterium]
MKKSLEMINFPSDGKKGTYDDLFSFENARNIRAFHQTLEGYCETPVRKLDGLADYLGLRNVYVKDESFRFDLNAFKGLGGSYALGKVIAQKEHIAMEQLSSVKPKTYTVVTATDGNHGRGIAWAAKNLSQNAVVYMPKGSKKERLENIRKLGAAAEITEYNYDDTVRFAAEQAENNGWLLIQDTAWDGYEEIPAYVMQGYMTMALETVEKLGDQIPTHIFLQAGVGAMAGALTGFFSDYYGENKPKIVIVEPDKANCVFRTAKANDGKLHAVKGNLDSIMAGLCCGEVCTVGWDVLKHHADYFCSCDDYMAADGMRILGNPIGNDARIISGESGAVTIGLLYHLICDGTWETYKKALSLNHESVVLCISTEGDTDKMNYRKIVWEGNFASLN